MRNAAAHAHTYCHRLRVLVVDDNVDAAEMLCDALRAQGYQVAVAHDGADGLARFDTFEPDIAILDIGLPSIDGFKLAKFVRADARFRMTPLIALSGYCSTTHRERATRAGFDHHLAKPSELSTITELLERYAALYR